MDFKDKYILWVFYGLIAWVFKFNGVALIIGACITGIIIKNIDMNFTKIIYWLQDHFNTDSRHELHPIC